ncbi:MAG: DUF1275 family protein [Steroidobacteraceae bacterium]
MRRDANAREAALNPVEWLLLLTAFAAGTVDIISFATLGGVFASAMTGNFALLAYYVAQSDSQAYLFGALLSGAMVVRKVEEVVLLPFISVGLAFWVHRRSRRKAA